MLKVLDSFYFDEGAEEFRDEQLRTILCIFKNTSQKKQSRISKKERDCLGKRFVSSA